MLVTCYMCPQAGDMLPLTLMKVLVLLLSLSYRTADHNKYDYNAYNSCLYVYVFR